MAHTPQHPPTASSAARARPRPGRAQRHLRCSAPGRGAPPPPRRRSPSPQRVASLERPASAPSQPPSGQPAAAARHTRHPARDALLLATGTDLLGTGGVAHSQRALAEVLAARIRDGRTLCCPHSVAPTLAEQEAKALRLFEAVRVRARGSRVAPVRARVEGCNARQRLTERPRSDSSTLTRPRAGRAAPATTSCCCRASWRRRALRWAAGRRAEGRGLPQSPTSLLVASQRPGPRQARTCRWHGPWVCGPQCSARRYTTWAVSVGSVRSPSLQTLPGRTQPRGCWWSTATSAV